MLREVILKKVNEAMSIAKSLLIDEYVAQGHKNTGRLINEMQIQIEQQLFKISGVLLVNDYAKYLEERTPAARIPFTRGSGRKKSKYIEGLTKYWKDRGLNAVQALGAAFATAIKHKREGRPTRRSYAYSTNGRRTGAIKHAFSSNNLQKIENIFLDDDLVLTFQNYVAQAA